MLLVMPGHRVLRHVCVCTGDATQERAAGNDSLGHLRYKLEVWDKDTLLAQQRVHEYIAASHTFILKGALAPTGAPGSMDIKAGATFNVYPDQLLPQVVALSSSSPSPPPCPPPLASALAVQGCLLCILRTLLLLTPPPPLPLSRSSDRALAVGVVRLCECVLTVFLSIPPYLPLGRLR